MALRPLVHDFWTSARVAERLFILFALAACFSLPAFFDGMRLPADGFLFMTPPLAFLVFGHAMTMRWLGFAALGFWFALGRRARLEPEGFALELPVVLAFGTSWLLVLATGHFAHVGSPFGLRGWWPAGRAARGAIFGAAPAALAAWLALETWPLGGFAGPAAPERELDREALVRAISRMSAREIEEMLTRWAYAAAALGAALLALYWLRRYLGSRTKPTRVPMIFGAEVGAVEMLERAPDPPAPVLPGTRGEVVREWRRWARRTAPSDAPRAVSETAEEFARRLPLGGSAPKSEGREAEAGGADGSDATKEARARITRIFEAAHYGPDEPDAEDVAAIRALADRDPRA